MLSSSDSLLGGIAAKHEVLEDGMTDAPPFEEDPPREPGASAAELHLDIAGFEGPIDVLLQLAREQKVDLTQIRIFDLAEQYLAFVREAHRLRLELAADYLVMAAWLAYLKSRLLLPEPAHTEDEASGAEMAAALRFQLQRLQAMQDAGQKLLNRPRLGRDVFPCGQAAEPEVVTAVVYDCSFYDLLRAYADLRQRQGPENLRVDPMDLESVEDAMARLRHALGASPAWTTLMTFMPSGLATPLQRRSACAATFAASLELCREGRAELHQADTFGPIYVRARTPAAAGDGEDGA
jgi:segregation and condensation protein A